MPIIDSVNILVPILPSLRRSQSTQAAVPQPPLPDSLLDGGGQLDGDGDAEEHPAPEGCLVQHFTLRVHVM